MAVCCATQALKASRLDGGQYMHVEQRGKLELTKQRRRDRLVSVGLYAQLESGAPCPPLLSTAAASCRNTLLRRGDETRTLA